MKKILLTQDNELHTSILKDLDVWKPKLEPLKLAYEALEIGEFTSEVFDLVKVNSDKIEPRYLKEVEDQITRSKMTFKVIQDQIRTAAQEPLEAFNEAKHAFLSTRPSAVERGQTLQIGDISYDDRKGLYVSDEVSKRILEELCSVYAETEGEIAIYHALNEFADAYKKLDKHLEDGGYKSVPGFNDGVIRTGDLLASNEGVIAPRFTAITSKRFHERMEQSRMAREAARAKRAEKERETYREMYGDPSQYSEAIRDDDEEDTLKEPIIDIENV